MDDIKQFNGGMNSDVSPVSQPPNTYVSANNIEIIDDEAQGSIAITNSKGNKFQITIPDVGTIAKVTIATSGVTNITINGQSGATFTSDSILDLYNYVSTDAAYTLLGVQYDIYYSDTILLIIPRTGFAITATVSTADLILDSTYIPAQTNLQVIGYTTIRDDIYLFTTNCRDTNPQLNGGGYGQIWKLTYNNITLAAADTTLTLIYTNDVSFTTYYSIPQTAVLGRYENGSTQKIYWTDNYNQLRSINVVDPQVPALDVTLLDVIPAVDFDIPILTDIQAAAGTAAIDIGCYQLAYRFKNTGGSETGFSPLSNMVFVVDADEALQINGNNWKNYVGADGGTTTTKTFTWIINNIDVDFERIEFALLTRSNKNATPIIYLFPDEPVDGQESITFTITGDDIKDDTTTILTLEEFLALSGVFTHCKTIGSKDNRLVAGNVRVTREELDYDARAFRAFTNNATSTDIKLTNGTAANADFTLINAEALDESEDTINEYTTANACYYKPNTAIATLGGAGANISYEFITVATAVDKSFGITDFAAGPFVSTNPDYTTDRISLNVYSDAIKQEYNTSFNGAINAGIKFPQYNSVLIGYQATEIYRMGIQFYDKAKNPYFTKWIGDIKFPDYGDPIPAANCLYENMVDTTGATTYVKIFQGGGGTHPITYSYNNQLGIKMTVNIPKELSEKISGYSIVRVKRTESDKTIVAEGIVTSEAQLNGPEFYIEDTAAAPFLDTSMGLNPFVFFSTPNFLDTGLSTPSVGMNIVPKFDLGILNPTRHICPAAVCANGKYDMYKLFVQSVTAATSKTITAISEIGGYTTWNSPGGSIVNNWIQDIATGETTGGGSTNYIMEVGAAFAPAANTKLFCLITRVNNNQYGGNTYTARSNNEYILCSHFKPIKTSALDTTETFYLMGGDVTSGIMDDQRVFKNTDGSVTINVPQSTTFFYPASSSVNIGLRHGNHVNGKNFPYLSDRDSYDYNKAYSCENDIVTFFPKPDPFIENEVFDNRFYISEIKINGEHLDSWAVYKANNYWDVEGIYGPINSMLNLKDKMYFWQDQAFGVIEINPRAVVTDVNATTNSELQVGTGLPLQRHDYISTVIGSKHQSSIIASSYKLYWFDVNTRKIYEYTPGEVAKPFSDVEGLYSFLSKNLNGEIQNWDKPTYKFFDKGLNAVMATYDFKKHMAIFTFHSGISTGRESFVQTDFTVAINERLDFIQCFYDFTPRIYINDHKYIFSTDNKLAGELGLNDIYMHNVGNYGEYYGTVYPETIKFIVNPQANLTKTFDNFVYDSQMVKYDSVTNSYTNYNDLTWTSLRVTDDYQNTDTQSLVLNTNIKRKERRWQLAIPRNRVLYTSSDSPNIYTDLSVGDKAYGERIRDKYIQVELSYNNVDNKELKFNNFTTKYRTSDR